MPSKITARIKKKVDAATQKRAEEEQAAANPKSESQEEQVAPNPYKKLLLFFSILPIMFVLPYLFRGLVGVMRDKMDYVKIIWVPYAVFVVVMYFVKKNHTNESFISQFLSWVLFTMGVQVLGIFQLVDPADRTVMLKLWATLTFPLYAVYCYLDDFDYAKQLRKELSKEKKRKEHAEKRDAKLKELKAEREKNIREFRSQF